MRKTETTIYSKGGSTEPRGDNPGKFVSGVPPPPPQPASSGPKNPLGTNRDMYNIEEVPKLLRSGVVVQKNLFVAGTATAQEGRPLEKILQMDPSSTVTTTKRVPLAMGK